jgi:Putative beta-barrel porin-2, OmpL-like. bbp2
MKKSIYIKSAIIILTYFLTQLTATFGQTTLTTFGGSMDMYYKYDFSKNNNSYTSFTGSHDSFEIGMASIEASHKLGKASVFADLGFGTRAAQFSYNDKTTTFMIKQLYVTYDYSPKFKVTAGSFTTHLGYELVDAVDNKNYSMSYAFTYGPFFNTGIKAQYTSGKYSCMLGITNPTDFKTATEAGSKQKTVIGQIAYVGTTGSAYFNVTSGSSNPSTTKNKTQFDFVGSKKINDKFSLGFNGTYALVTDDLDSNLNGNWFAIVGYANCTVKPNLTVAYRLEYFEDNDGVVAFTGGANVIGNTLSINFKEGNLTFIPEVRFDTASEKIFTDGKPTENTVFALVGLTYSF